MPPTSSFESNVTSVASPAPLAGGPVSGKNCTMKAGTPEKFRSLGTSPQTRATPLKAKFPLCTWLCEMSTLTLAGTSLNGSCATCATALEPPSADAGGEASDGAGADADSVV